MEKVKKIIKYSRRSTVREVPDDVGGSIVSSDANCLGCFVLETCGSIIYSEIVEFLTKTALSGNFLEDFE